MTEQTLMTEQATTTTEGQAASQSTEQPSATAAQEQGQQQQQAPEGQQAASTEQAQAEQEGPPENYEFQAPEGVTVDDHLIGQFTEVAKELNLPKDVAQKVLDKMAPAMAARQAEQIQAVQQQWAEQATNDKEFGGEQLQENLSLAKKAMNSLATPELVSLLNESGLGNHPEVIRVFVRAGKLISEDSFVKGSNAPAARAGDAKSFYPNSNMN